MVFAPQINLSLHTVDCWKEKFTTDNELVLNGNGFESLKQVVMTLFHGSCVRKKKLGVENPLCTPLVFYNVVEI